MSRRTKRVNNGSVVLMLILFVVLGVNINSLHVYAEKWGDYEYEVLDDGTVNIETYMGNDVVLVIPSTIAQKKVTSIEWGAFENCSGLTNVTIPASVTSIDWHVFSGCSGLMNISVAENNPNYCSETGVLFNKDKSELVCYPAGKKGKYTVPASVIIIGWYAFSGCSGLTNVTIPASVTSIERNAFSDCSGLANVTIPASVKSIEWRAFSGCSGLTNVTIPTSVTDIECGAFEDCSGLTNVIIPASVTSIESFAFSGCSRLTNVIIPGSVTSMDDAVFSGCSGLMDISVAANNPNYCSETGVLFNKDKSELVCYPAGKKGSYTIPTSVTNIDSYAFSGCSGLTSLIIPENVTSIHFRAFEDCSGLTSLTIPGSVTNIDLAVFSGCSGLTDISVAKNNPSYCSETGVLFNKDKSVLICYPAGKKGKYIVPKNVTCIYVGAFHGCSGLTNLTIPRSVTEIVPGGPSDRGFEGCYNITLLVERDSYAEQYAKVKKIPYKYIGEDNTDNKTEESKQPVLEQPVPNPPVEEEAKVVVGNVTMVPIATETDDKPVVDDKVKNQNGFNTIKKGTVLVSSMGIYKVTNVKKKTVIYMKPKNKKACSVKIPEEIKINKKKYKVTSVSANAFRNNKKIKTVTIGQNVKEIGKNAFRGCKNLKKVTIGKNVTTIGNYAFYSCKELNLIEIRSSKLKKVGKAAFKKIAKKPTARVPKGKIQSYKKLFKGKM